MLQVNVERADGPHSHRACKACSPAKKGRILNIASTAGFQPGPDMAMYYATKAFVLLFSEGVADEVRKTGVTVTAHCPGATATHFGGDRRQRPRAC